MYAEFASKHSYTLIGENVPRSVVVEKQPFFDETGNILLLFKEKETSIPRQGDRVPKVHF